MNDYERLKYPIRRRKYGRCKYITDKGNRCKVTAIVGRYCVVHHRIRCMKGVKK